MFDNIIFEHLGSDWHGFLLMALLLALISYTWRSYGKLSQSWLYYTGRCLRIATLVILFLLLAGPAWQSSDLWRDAGHVIVAVDSSASMANDDGQNNSENNETAKTRIELVNELNNELKILRERDTKIQYWDLGTNNEAQIENIGQIEAAQHSSSPLARQLEQMLTRQRADHVIFLSDGRQTEQRNWDRVAQRLQRRDIGLSILAVGSDRIRPEMSIDDIIGPRLIPRGERQPYLAHIHYRGINENSPAQFEIFDKNNKQLFAQEFTLSGSTSAERQLHQQDFALSFNEVGTHTLRLLVRSGELQSEQFLDIHVEERKLQVLMLARHPRYDMRYLRTALSRDRTVEVHSFLYSGTWSRWGDGSYGPNRLEFSAKFFNNYDAIIIGDIPVSAFPPEGLQHINQAVRQFGTGLIWIPGAAGHIASFANGPLEELLPVTLPEQKDIARGYVTNQRVHVELSQLAQIQNLLISGDLAWKDLPANRGICPVDEVLPGSKILMQRVQSGNEENATPIVVARDYDAGRSVFIAIDDSWRWRAGTADNYLHRFHSQLLRYASHGRLLAEQPWLITATPQTLHQGEEVEIALRAAGALPAEQRKPRRVSLRMSHAQRGERILELEKRSETWVARITAPMPGNWRLEIAEGINEDKVRSGSLTVLPPDLEQRDPRRDLASLEKLAGLSNGQVFISSKELVQAMPDLERSRRLERRKSLWDDWILLTLLIFTLSLEWFLRRLHRYP